MCPDVEQLESLLLDVAEGRRTGLGRDDRQVAARSARIGEAAGQERRLDAAPAVGGQRRGTAELRHAVPLVQTHRSTAGETLLPPGEVEVETPGGDQVAHRVSQLVGGKALVGGDAAVVGCREPFDEDAEPGLEPVGPGVGDDHASGRFERGARESAAENGFEAPEAVTAARQQLSDRGRAEARELDLDRALAAGEVALHLLELPGGRDLAESQTRHLVQGRAVSRERGDTAAEGSGERRRGARASLVGDAGQEPTLRPLDAGGEIDIGENHGRLGGSDRAEGCRGDYTVRSRLRPRKARVHPNSSTSFSDLGLPDSVLAAVEAAGYEAPSAIQSAAIPVLLEGRDLVGQAQTGTGKTAAFALPLLSRLDMDVAPERGKPRILVLAPTRELAIQVAEAMQTYARGLPGFHVLPIYGGQSYEPQLRRLRRGVHAVVGTPGRVIDHLRKGTLRLDAVESVVLDEADEMLRMGFLEDVESILESTPEERLTALFSATMPPEIARVAKSHLRDPQRIEIEAETATVDTVRQRYWRVRGIDKLDALTRILEVETFDAMLVFVRTKVTTVALAEKLEARGFSSAALNGDLNQALRERTVERLKNGALDIVVATDVAARGLDVDRISHVVNFDVPYDVEAYVHRIGRTGRAGRQGEAILFVEHREQRMLRSIERATRQSIEPMGLPSREKVTERRIAEIADVVAEAVTEVDLEPYEGIVASLAADADVDPQRLAAALLYLHQRERPFFPVELSGEDRGLSGPDSFEELRKKPKWDDRGGPGPRGRGPSGPPAGPRGPRVGRPGDEGLRRYRIEVGRRHGVQVKNIVGAIANEAGLDSRSIGRIDILGNWSAVELPADLPKDVLQHLGGVWVCGRQLRIAPDQGPPKGRSNHHRSTPNKKSLGRKGRKPRRE